MITWELALLMLLAAIGGIALPILLAAFFIGRWTDEQCKRLDAFHQRLDAQYEASRQRIAAMYERSAAEHKEWRKETDAMNERMDAEHKAWCERVDAEHKAWCERVDALLDPVARDAKVEAEVAKRLKERS